MELNKVEKQRSGLLQSLILLIMVLLGLIMYFAYREVSGYSIPALAVVSLLACLYVLSKERRLKTLESALVDNLVARDREVNRLGHKLQEERSELVEEKGKAADLQERLQEITALYRAIDKVNAETDDDKIIGVALRAALDLVGADRGSIMLLDKQKAHLYVASALGLKDEVVSSTRQEIGQGVAGWVAQYGEAVLLSGDALDDERFSNPTAMTGQIRSAMCVPLNLRNEAIGVMNLAVTDARSELTDYHMRLATIFGQHASVSVMNIRLLRSLRKAKASG